jgi:hypothetical protein
MPGSRPSGLKKAGRGRPPKAAAAIIIAVAALAAGLAVWLLHPGRLRVGFYDVDPALVSSVSSTVDAWAKSQGMAVGYRKKQLADLGGKSLRGIDLVFLYPSRPNLARAEAFADANPALAARLPLPLRRSIQAGERVWALPVTADTKELAWRKDLFPKGAKTGDFRLGSLDERARSAVNKVDSPIVAPGGDDRELLDLAGILVLERGGLAAYDAFAGSTGLPGDAMDRDLGGFSLREAVAPLIEYRKDSLIHANWLEFKGSDVIAFVEDGVAGLSLQTFSIHRQVVHEAITEWGSAVVALPAASGSGLPVATASILSMARPKTGGREKKAARLSEYLLSNEGQKALQAGMGLAPVSSTAQAVDIQASEARVVVDGAQVTQGLSRDAFTSADERARFASALRIYLRSAAQR